MRAQLTRNVYRASPRLRTLHSPLLPLLSLSLAHQSPRLCVAPIPSYIFLARRPSRRTFFGVFQKPPREVKEPEFEPGYDVLLQFRASETEVARPPPRHDLVEGFVRFFTYKQRHRRPANATQAFCALRVFFYLQDPSADGPRLRLNPLLRVQEVLLHRPRDDCKHHLELARQVYQELRRQRSTEREVGRGNSEEYWEDFRGYVTALSQYGAAKEAFDRVVEYYQGRRLQPKDVHLWMVILRGIANEGDEKALRLAVSATEGQGIPYGPAFKEIMTSFYARRDDADSLWMWFDKGKVTETADTYKELLEYSRRQPEVEEVVRKRFQNLCDSNPHREFWDVILQWAVSSLGKGVQDIKELVHKLARQDNTYPDITTINSLIRTAMDMKDPLLAERFLSWCTSLRLKPDAHTYALQVEYRLEARDFSGAHEAFRRLMNHAETPENGFDDGLDAHAHIEPVANKYLRVLCSAEQQQQQPGNSGRLMEVLGLVEEFRVPLEPETTAALSLAFLENDQQFELMDTLSLHTFRYSLEERRVVREAMVSYCLSEAHSTRRVWDAYSLLRQFFPETDRATRVRLMEAFFRARRRPDMAVMVFGHMRAHGNESMRPDLDTYVRALASLALHPDGHSLRMVHNMLKMDARVQPDTRLYNALMMAYTGCGDPSTSLEFWRDVTHSAEGPSYNSLAAVFWACERLPFGDAKAREVWAKMQRMDVEVLPFVFGAYLGAIAGQGNVEEVKGLLRGMDGSVGYHPDVSMLRIVYNAFPGPQYKEQFEEWARREYASLWSELTRKLPRSKSAETGLLEFKHPRDDITP